MVSKTHEDPDIDRLAGELALFSVLIHARHKHDFARAAQTQEELENRGIVVRFRRHAGREEVAHAE